MQPNLHIEVLLYPWTTLLISTSKLETLVHEFLYARYVTVREYHTLINHILTPHQLSDLEFATMKKYENITTTFNGTHQEFNGSFIDSAMPCFIQSIIVNEIEYFNDDSEEEDDVDELNLNVTNDLNMDNINGNSNYQDEDGPIDGSQFISKTNRYIKLKDVQLILHLYSFRDIDTKTKTKTKVNKRTDTNNHNNRSETYQSEWFHEDPASSSQNINLDNDISDIVSIDEILADNMDKMKVYKLPCSEFNGLWQNLTFNDDIKSNLLNYMKSILYFSKKNVDFDIISYNKLLLLHGIPGTGKTSLFKALSQKLSIRFLKNQFKNGCILFDISCDSLFSRWYGESSKIVGNLLNSIEEYLIKCSEKSFVVILIDEVESIAGSREAIMRRDETSDSIRVVNTLLTHLDKLRYHKNVLVLATSNLLSGIDTAFIDRADIVKYVGPPSVKGTYTILQGCLNELVRTKVILSERPIPDYSWALITRKSDPDCISSLLYQVAEKCSEASLSGRAIRKLSLTTHYQYFSTSAKKDMVPFLRYMIKVVKQVAKQVEN